MPTPRFQTHVVLTTPEGQRLEFSSEPGRADGGIKSGRITLSEGKKASVANITIPDPRLIYANLLPLPYRRERTLVELYWGEAPSPNKVFVGYLSGFKSSVGNGTTTLQITDRGRDMRNTERTRVFSRKTLAQLAQTIATDNTLSLDVSAAPGLEDVSFRKIVQHGESDWSVLHRTLNNSGFAAYVRGGTLFVRASGSFRDDPTIVRCVFGQNVSSGSSFSVEEFRRSTTPNVYDRGGNLTFDAASQLFPEADTFTAHNVVRLARTGLSSVAGDFPSLDAQTYEDTLRAQRRAKKIFTGRVELTDAHPLAEVDDQAFLVGFGDRFSGVWNIERVEHDITKQRTSLSIYNGGATV